MTADRPYRTAMSTEVALSEPKACAGSQFDRVIVDALASVITQRRAAPPNLHAPRYPDT